VSPHLGKPGSWQAIPFGIEGVFRMRLSYASVVQASMSLSIEGF
jgi:hypothetical protein